MTDALEGHEGTVCIGGRTVTSLRFGDDINGLAGEEEELEWFGCLGCFVCLFVLNLKKFFGCSEGSLRDFAVQTFGCKCFHDKGVSRDHVARAAYPNQRGR